MHDTIKLNTGVKMIAHRGVSALERENSIAAFVAAGNRSHYGIETDVHVTKDGQFIVIHDDSTQRVTGVEGIVEEMTFDQLRTLHLFFIQMDIAHFAVQITSGSQFKCCVYRCFRCFCSCPHFLFPLC